MGGPAAAVSLPVTRTGALLVPQTQTSHAAGKEVDKGKGKGKEKIDERDVAQHTLWRDRFVGTAHEAGKSFKQTLDGVHGGKKRKSSDASFWCQGVYGAPLDRYQVSELSPSDEEQEDMLPPRLFSGMRGGRDTKFYQPYVEVLDEY